MTAANVEYHLERLAAGGDAPSAIVVEVLGASALAFLIIRNTDILALTAFTAKRPNQTARPAKQTNHHGHNTAGAAAGARLRADALG